MKKFTYTSMLLKYFLATLCFVTTGVFAATDLTNTPLAVQSIVPPNIVYTLDNSGSMDWAYIPDTAGGNLITPLNCYRNAVFNPMYYNPNVVYVPGTRADGTSYPNATYTAAPLDGYTIGSPTVNLSTGYRAYSSTSTTIDTVASAAYYYMYTGNLPATPVAQNCYGNASYTKYNVTAATSFTKKDETQNFANWFSYYRTRMNTVKSSLSIAFNVLNANYNVGFTTINDNAGANNTAGANFRALASFTGAARTAWYATLFSVKPTGTTPLPDAIRRVGEYYRTGTMQGINGTPDPIQYSCQKNYQILSTDGFWNVALTAALNPTNQDRTVPALPAAVPNDPLSGTALTTGQQFPRPFYEGAAVTNNTLADIAMYYWVTDLWNNRAAPAKTGSVAKVPGLDPATWTHMNLYGLALSPGSVPTNQNLLDPNFNWPVPSVNGALENIDDLWHASVNGHGQFFTALSPADIQSALNSILSSIVAASGTDAGTSVTSPVLSTAGQNTAYSSQYFSGDWSGNLFAYAINPLTATISSTPLWATSPQAQLDSAVATNRVIATFNGTAGVPFRATSLNTTLLARLNSPYTPPGPTDNATVINFLRGDKSNEVQAGVGLYRARKHLLGDIIDSNTSFLKNPNMGLPDPGYALFSRTNAYRQPMVFVGANDGMLHAFNATTGAESWAYIPGILLNTPLSTANPNTSSLVNLSNKTNFTHTNYVNGQLVWGDVYDTASSNWMTLLVGGLGNGGKGFYALDVTDPTAMTTEAGLASKVKWEFTNNNLGYSYGKPAIVKTKAYGWVVLVSSGYNNVTGDGQGHLFVLKATTGALLKDISTNVGSPSNPSGFAKFSVDIPSYPDLTADYVYGGDLLGNLWRFDISDADNTKWNVKLLTTLVDKSGVVQAITSEPEIGKVMTNRMIMVGTGENLGSTDLPSSTLPSIHTNQTQSIYGIFDNLSVTPYVTPGRGNMTALTSTLQSDGSYIVANATNSPITKYGWFFDLPATFERIYTNPVLIRDNVAFTSNIPSNLACTPGGTSRTYLIQFSSGIGTSSVINNWLIGDPNVVVDTTGAPHLVLTPEVGTAPPSTITANLQGQTPKTNVFYNLWRSLWH